MDAWSHRPRAFVRTLSYAILRASGQTCLQKSFDLLAAGLLAESAAAGREEDPAASISLYMLSMISEKEEKKEGM